MRPLQNPDPSSPFHDALALAHGARFEEARARALEVAGAAPDEALSRVAAETLARIARLAEGAGADQAAEPALADAVRLRPGYADLHFQRGVLLARLGRRAEARRSLEAALRIHSNYVAARLELAMLDAREGRIGEALAALRELERDERIHEPRAFQQGLVSLERADWDGADSLLRRSVRASDPRLERRLEEFHALMSEGALERAAECMRAALDGHEAYPDLHARLGTAELSMGHLDDAASSFARALELQPDLHPARVQFARALDALGQRAAALDQLALVIGRDPENAPALELAHQWTPRLHPGRDSSARKGS
ncbi:MAG: tetratricopeptide repeat protein [Candidatus Eisenbacteria bacterium]|nr:tetratricopeptide repeat protein [Candidatus Eisenbacteria bacterium]